MVSEKGLESAREKALAAKTMDFMLSVSDIGKILHQPKSEPDETGEEETNWSTLYWNNEKEKRINNDCRLSP